VSEIYDVLNYPVYTNFQTSGPSEQWTFGAMDLGNIASSPKIQCRKLLCFCLL